MKNTSPRWRPGEGWMLDETPQLTIGGVEGDPKYELFRVTGALRLSDGRIVIANSGSSQLRVYSSRGEHRRDLGRRGEGPGEFEWIHEAWRAAGDSVLVYDRSSAYLNELGSTQESRRWNHTMTGVPQSMYLPFAVGAPIFTAGGGPLYVGNGSAFEVEARTSDGELDRILRWSGNPRKITRADVARYRKATLASIPDENRRRARERWLDAVPFPDRMPTYQGLLVDALDHLWIEQYRVPWEDRRRWWIVDPDGAWLGEVETPAGFTIYEIGSDYLLALGHGEHEIEIVALFSLRR